MGKSKVVKEGKNDSNPVKYLTLDTWVKDVVKYIVVRKRARLIRASIIIDTSKSIRERRREQTKLSVEDKLAIKKIKEDINENFVCINVNHDYICPYLEKDERVSNSMILCGYIGKKYRKPWVLIEERGRSFFSLPEPPLSCGGISFREMKFMSTFNNINNIWTPM